MFLVSAMIIIFLVAKLSSSSTGAPAGTPKVVVVTILDHEKMSKGYISKVEENRKDYAARHGMLRAQQGRDRHLTFPSRLRYLFP